MYNNNETLYVVESVNYVDGKLKFIKAKFNNQEEAVRYYKTIPTQQLISNSYDLGFEDPWKLEKFYEQLPKAHKVS